MILFLDFDGVLHPDAAYLVHGKPALKADGELFMWAPILIDVLATRPDIRLVLSTSWVRELGFKRARARLPEALAQRVIGATWHSAMLLQADPAYSAQYSTWWDRVTRYQQIARYVERAQLMNWIAIDDDGEGWAGSARHRLVLTNSDTGLACPITLRELELRLDEGAP